MGPSTPHEGSRVPPGTEPATGFNASVIICLRAVETDAGALDNDTFLKSRYMMTIPPADTRKGTSLRLMHISLELTVVAHHI